MTKEQKEILKKLGFDNSTKGAKYFVDIVDDVVEDLMNNKEEQEILEAIPSYYMEYAHFFYEVGLIRFKKEIENFHMNKTLEEIDIDLYTEIYEEIENPSIEESILVLGKYLFKNKKKDPKVLKKVNL